MIRSCRRRHFLRGLGTAIAVPSLTSLTPRSLRAQSSTPLRYVAVYVPYGIHMPAFRPAEAGADFTLPPTLAPLANVRGKISVHSGLANMPAQPDQNGSHTTGTTSFLTCRAIPRSETVIRNGISADQVHAQGSEPTRFRSIQLGGQGTDRSGNAVGYSGVYPRSISWLDEITPLPKFTDPVAAFDFMFGDGGAGVGALALARRSAQRSALDYVREQSASLRTQLGVDDQHKLDEYLDSVRELERRVDEQAMAPACEGPSVDVEAPTISEHADLMSALMVAAMRCDMTRALSFMLGAPHVIRSLAFLGIDNDHHTVSHHGGDLTKFEQLKAMDYWEVSRLAYLLEQMDAVVEDNGQTMLDNSVVIFGSGISDGDRHIHDDLPLVVAGSAGGAFTPGRHVVHAELTPLANLHIALLQALGHEIDSFGDVGSEAAALA